MSDPGDRDSQRPQASGDSPEPSSQPAAGLSSNTPPASESTTELQAAVTAAARSWVRSAWDPIFGAGEIVAGRYRIVRFLAGGGAGEVYEAEDRELGGRVALKAIRHAVSGDPRRFERFRREIHLARKVTHPNVCRIYDAGHHLRADAEGSGPMPAAPAALGDYASQARGQSPQLTEVAGDRRQGHAPVDIFFITMELLEGETLATRLAVDERLAPAVAVPILRQIADGLDAAHAAGVIHRDLKSANVMLVPVPEKPGSVRAVVTDFGLARLRDEGDGSGAAGVTLSGVILGTPSYMAPEQVEGTEITAAVDIYALGVMMFEIATGELPFRGETPLSVALKRLQAEPPSPRATWPSIDARWDRVIRRCMARQPEDRFPSAGAAVRALGDEKTERLQARAARPAQAKAWIAALLSIAAVAALLWSWRSTHRGDVGPASRPPFAPPVAAAKPAAIRPAVAVLGFKNNSGENDSGKRASAWLSTAFAEMLSTEISAGERVRSVPGETVARVKRELKLPDADSLAPDTLRRIRNSMGNDYVLLGSYVALKTNVRLEYRLQDTASGKVVLSGSQQSEQEKIFDLVGRAGAELRAGLVGVGALGDAETSAVQAARPASSEAARLYAQGLASLRLFDAIGSREALEQAVAADPAFPFAHSALAEAWDRLGYDGRAREEAERAFQLAAGLPREERLVIEARAKQAAKDYPRAAETYRELVRLFPDDPDYRLYLANALVEAANPAGALTVLAEIPSPAGAPPDARVPITEALAANRLSDFQRQRQAAVRAAAIGRDAGAALLVARARHYEGLALASLGQPEDAIAAYEDALAAYRGTGDHFAEAQELRAIAAVLRGQGKLDDAERSANESLKICTAIGAKAEAARALNTLSNIYYQRGNLREAARGYETNLAIFRETGDRRGEGAMLNNLANARSSLGDLAGAIAAQEQALVIARQAGSKNGIATSLIGLATAQFARGDLRNADGHLTEALSLTRASGEKSLTAWSLFTLGDVARARGELAESRQDHSEALNIRRQIGEHGAVSESRVAIAQLDLEEGRLGEARTALTAAARDSQKEGDSDSEAQARTILARCLRLAAGAGDMKAARAELARAAELTAHTDNFAYRLATDIERARLDAATGQQPAALERLRSAIRQAKQRGLLGEELEARLAVAELGSPRDLAALAADAESKGYGLIAAKARRKPARA